MRWSKKALSFLLGTVLFLLAGLVLVLFLTRGASFGVIPEKNLISIPVQELPEDTLFITEGRRQYPRGAMTLIIPSIDVYTPVGESTLPQGLQEMPGLYEFSQLPAQGNVNVSIAGHRDIYDMVFYHLDKISHGDFLYLIYEGTVFRYQFQGARIIAPDDWSVIFPQDFSCLTLTTCDPIGTSLNRLVVTAALQDSAPYHEHYLFLTNANEMT